MKGRKVIRRLLGGGGLPQDGILFYCDMGAGRGGVKQTSVLGVN